jgi:hypothetical protein
MGDFELLVWRLECVGGGDDLGKMGLGKKSHEFGKGNTTLSVKKIRIIFFSFYRNNSFFSFFSRAIERYDNLVG